MKKITTFTAVIALAITVASCSKTSSGYLPSSSNNHVSSRQEQVKVRLVSDWQNIPLNITSVNGSNQLTGQSTLTQIVSYELGMHKQFAYAKFQGRDGFSYKPLPMSYPTPIGNHAFNFSLDFSTFKLSINNSDHAGRLLATQDFSNFQYRYIVVPVEVYQSLQIDWNDLSAVAAALNFSL